YTRYHRAVEQVLASPSPYWGPEDRPRHVVLGHTHYVDRAPLEVTEGLLRHTVHEATYHNTGTWLENVFVDRAGRVVQHDRICPVLKFRREDGAVRYTLDNAQTGMPLDVEAIRAFYE